MRYSEDEFEQELISKEKEDESADDHPRFVDHVAQAARRLNSLLDEHLPLGVVSTCSERRWVLDLEDVVVEMRHEPVGISAHASSAVMGRRRLNALRQELRQLVSTSIHISACSTFAICTRLLQMAELAIWHRDDWLGSTRSSEAVAKGWDASKISGWKDVLDNPHGVDLLSVNDTAEFVLGKPISRILAGITDELRVVHVEPVFRGDLVTRFLRKRRTLKTQLLQLSKAQLRKSINGEDIRRGRVEDSHEGFAEYLSTPRVSFHGAPKPVIASIVRYGFVLPNERIGNDKDAATLEIRCGASYGVGIYSSPSLDFACMYAPERHEGGYSPNAYNAPGFRIIVCATIMGRPLEVTREDTRRTQGVSKEGAHSHVSPDGLQYIVFDKAQIIPCYVLHLDLGTDDAKKHFSYLRTNPGAMNSTKSAPKSRIQTDADEDSPAAVVAKKAALKAAATKWFPYGFGSATGTQFVIEDIAPVDDDEEEYGDFQAIRKEQSYEIQEKMERGDDEKQSWFDEYQGARETWGKVEVGK